jgi:hypothetical protein
MFPLARATLPADAESLRAAIEEGLRRTLRAPQEMVSVRDERYPELAEIRVSLDDAILAERPPQLATPAGEVQPALRVGALAISGSRIRVQGAAVDLKCQARDVAIGQGHDQAGNLVLVLQNAVEGSVEIRLTTADLENLVRAGAKEVAGQQGVAIEDVHIELRSRSERALDVTVQVRAKKLFLSASVRISGSAEIDEQLTARLHGLTCTGDGTLGTLACGFLTPHLQRFDGREFSLLALSLGEVKLRDVRVSAGDELRLSAQFGGA